MDTGKRMSKAEILAIRKQRKTQRQAVNAPEIATATRPHAANSVRQSPPKTSAQVQHSSEAPLTEAIAHPAAVGGPESSQKPAASAPIVAEPPSNQPPKPKLHGAATSAPLPKGFFDDKKSDALAHGERLRTAKDDAHDLDVFQREVEQLEEQRQNLEAREAEQTAERAAALDEFESGLKREQLESLKKRQRVGVSDERTVELVKTALHTKPTEKDAVQPTMGQGLSSSDSDTDDDPLNTVKSDWRSKR